MIPGATPVRHQRTTRRPTVPWHDAATMSRTHLSAPDSRPAGPSRAVARKGARTASRLVASVLPGVGVGLWWVLCAPVAFAHGADSLLPPVLPADLLLDWSLDPSVALPLLLLGTTYGWAVRRVNTMHPSNPVPLARTVAFVGGLIAIAVALQSVIERYDTTLFSVHMLQHILLTLVAAPLLALGAPITLLLRVTRPEFRRRFVLPVLHSRLVRVLAFPVLTWVLFAGVMWGTHFSPIFEQSLSDPLVHDLEHLLYLTAGLLFWWPAVGLDPSPWRMSHPVRAMYLFLQMPQNTFLALAIYSASVPLYAHYANLQLSWGPGALPDQQLAGGLMWIVGDVVFISSMALVVRGWMRNEERDTARLERRADVDRAAIHARETALADRLSRERGDAERF